MAIWIAAVLMAFGVTLALARSLLRRPPAVTDRQMIDLAVFRDQIAEVDRDVARNLIPADEAEATRIEISRRMLARDRAGRTDMPDAQGASALPRRALAAVVLILPAAIGLYAFLGTPNVGTALKHSAEQLEMTKLVENLAVKLESRPNDLEGFRLLARSASGISRFDLALPAYRRALELNGNKDTALVGDFAEALVMSERAVVPEARRAFNAVLESDPKDARARYYLAEAQAEIGAWDKAIDQWQAIIADAPPEADYLDMVRERIADASQKLGRALPPAEIGGNAPGSAPQASSTGPGPTAADMAAAAQMAPSDRQGMIESMVARLADRLKETPDDPEGWRKLARAYLVLGKIEPALAAYEQAVSRDPLSVDGLAGYAAALRQGPGPSDARYGRILEQLAARDPDNAEALMALGERDLRAGRIDDAKAKWARLLSGIPKDQPQRKAVLTRMRALAAETRTDLSALGLPD